VSLRTEIVKEVTRREPSANGLKVIHYYLCTDRSPNGGQFLYLKCHEEIWSPGSNPQGQSQLVRENFAVSGDFGENYYLALHIFRKIAEAQEVVSLEHLADVCRDELLEYTRKHSPKQVAEKPRLLELRSRR